MSPDWREKIAGWSRPEIIDALSCPPPTVHGWFRGKTQPPEWLQPIILAAIRARCGPPNAERARETVATFAQPAKMGRPTKTAEPAPFVEAAKAAGAAISASRRKGRVRAEK